MREGLLEIIVITYNRSNFLARTLDQLKNSFFCGCKITVLDNCSTDDTAAVCTVYSSSFPRFYFVSHPKNIGGNANYLRAAEISLSTYTWVLCDDDSLKFNDADDLLRALESEKFDLLEVGSTVRQPWEAGLATTTKEAVHRGCQYFLGLSFMPAVIFRTSLFDAACMSEGYDLVRSWYPHFALLIKALRIDASIYFAKQPLIKRNNVNESTFSPLSWYANWVNSCSFIVDSKLRKEAIRQATLRRGYFKSLAFWIAIEKHHDPSRFWEKITTIFVGYRGRQRLVLLFFIPIMLIPLPFTLLVSLRNLVYLVMRVPKDEIPPIVINTRNNG